MKEKARVTSNNNSGDDFVRRAVEYSILFFLLCRTLSAQTSQACQSDLNHLMLPGHATTDDGFGLRKTSLQFLFSQGGIDAYSANNFSVIRQKQRLGEPFDQSLTAVLVYQDERVRQSEIQSVQNKMRMRDLLDPSSHAPVSNLKFSTWRFRSSRMWHNRAPERKWFISGMAYFEPISCLPAKYQGPLSSEGYLEASMASPNLILEGLPGEEFAPNVRLMTAPNSVLSKTLEAMLAMLRKYGIGNR
ncbi:MAG TPA: hypothetical protein VMI06_14665 [Terriglobia bacterium]|nr:hypothetical protein [Terriglobia bacterium]